QRGEVLRPHEAAEHVGAGEAHVPVGVADGAPEEGVVLLDGAQRQRAVADTRLAASLEDGAADGLPRLGAADAAEALEDERREGPPETARPGGCRIAFEQPEQHRHALAVAQLPRRTNEVGVRALREL